VPKINFWIVKNCLQQGGANQFLIWSIFDIVDDQTLLNPFEEGFSNMPSKTMIYAFIPVFTALTMLQHLEQACNTVCPRNLCVLSRDIVTDQGKEVLDLIDPFNE